MFAVVRGTCVSPTERAPLPSRLTRILAVARRHVYVYTKDFWANSFPTVLEPLLFILAAIAAIRPFRSVEDRSETA